MREMKAATSKPSVAKALARSVKFEHKGGVLTATKEYAGREPLSHEVEPTQESIGAHVIQHMGLSGESEGPKDQE